VTGPSVRTLGAPDLLVDARAALGEGPVWDARAGRLLWVDIERGRVHTTDPDTGATSTRELGKSVGIVVPRASGGHVAVLADGFYALHHDGRVERLAHVDDDGGRFRFNDGACDPAGRFLAGTMARDSAPSAGALYRLETDLSVTRLLDGVTISNGLGWSPDGGTCYYVDTPTGCVFAFDYDGRDGSMSGRRVFVTIEGTPGRPDGLCVDEQGGVWVALWPGGAVRRYRPDATLDAVVPLPVSNVSSCGFGGADLDRLFITTAHEGLSADERRDQPLAGGLFVADVGVRGLPRPPFAG
jgi:sugar lactone lactonase YvrE